VWGDTWKRTRVLVTARTYPAPARKGVEVSCTGGITEDGHWIRLFPVPYRFLSDDQRFHKYQWIDVRISKASDYRPESYYPDIDSIEIASTPLPTDDACLARKEVIVPLQSPSLCALQFERNRNHSPTLGFFKPREITRLIIQSDNREWTAAELARLRQHSLFASAPTQELEKLPFTWKYEFTCADPSCNGHSLTCTDWEMGQSYRKWSRKYSDWTVPFRQRYEDEMINRFDTHFFVGTLHQYPSAWIIVGLFYPPKHLQMPVLSSKQLALESFG
jgi:hypothetical protein